MAAEVVAEGSRADVPALVAEVAEAIVCFLAGRDSAPLRAELDIAAGRLEGWRVHRCGPPAPEAAAA